jgi:hypothetical protein
MALTGPEVAILGITDRWAYQKEATIQVATGGTDVWHRVDNAQDEVFENRVKGQIATDLDAAFATVIYGQWNTMQQFLALLRDYVTVDLGYASIGAFLTARRLRVDARGGEVFSEWAGPGILAPANIHAHADAGDNVPGLLLGSFEYGGSLVAGSAVNPAVASESAILARVTAIGANDWTLTVTCERADESTADIVQVIKGTTGGGAVGDVYVLGRQALSGSASAGQAVVPVAETAQFAAGQKVLVTQWTGTAPDEVWVAQEVATISTITEDTSLTMTANLLHSYTVAAFVYPLWMAVTGCDDSGGQADDAVEFYPAADRRLRL